MILQPEEDGILRYMGYYCCFTIDGGSVVKSDILKFFPDFTVTALSCDSPHLPKYTALNPNSKGAVSGRWTLMGHKICIEFRKILSVQRYCGTLSGDVLKLQLNGETVSYRFHNRFDIEHDLMHDPRLEQ